MPPTPTPKLTSTPVPTPKLSATTALNCLASQLTAELTNVGSADGVVYIDVNGAVAPVVVAPGTTLNHVVDVEVGTDTRVIIHDGSVSLFDKTYESTCLDPAPELSAKYAFACDTGVVTVWVSNLGKAPGAATVVVDGVPTGVVVDPDETIKHVVPIDTTTGHSIEVRASSGDPAEVIVSAAGEACAEPEADIVAVVDVSCDTGDITLTIVNSGDATGGATYTINATTTTVSVDPGVTVTIVAAIDPGATNVIEVSVDSDVILSEAVERACETDEPDIDASVFEDCANGNVVVTLTNSGAVVGTATVVINGVATEVEVEVGAVASVAAPLPESGSYIIDVDVAGEPIFSQEATADCIASSPAAGTTAAIEFSCTRNEVRITIENMTSTDQDVTVSLNGEVDVVTATAQQSMLHVVQLVEDQTYELSAEAPDGTVLVQASGTHDCV